MGMGLAHLLGNGNRNWLVGLGEKLVCSEVSVNSPGIRGVSPEEEKEDYGGKAMQKRNVLSLE